MKTITVFMPSTRRRQQSANAGATSPETPWAAPPLTGFREPVRPAGALLSMLLRRAGRPLSAHHTTRGGIREQIDHITNRERRKNVAFLGQASSPPRSCR